MNERSNFCHARSQIIDRMKHLSNWEFEFIVFIFLTRNQNRKLNEIVIYISTHVNNSMYFMANTFICIQLWYLDPPLFRVKFKNVFGSVYPGGLYNDAAGPWRRDVRAPLPGNWPVISRHQAVILTQDYTHLHHNHATVMQPTSA